MKINQALEDHVANSLYDVFDSGTLKILSGDSLIVTIDLPFPAFLNANNGGKRINGPWESIATASGTASRCRLESRDRSKVMEGTVTTKGKGGDIELDNVNIQTGQMVTVADGKGLVA